MTLFLILILENKQNVDGSIYSIKQSELKRNFNPKILLKRIIISKKIF